jgi:Fe-Mn family superoxide dismutase
MTQQSSFLRFLHESDGSKVFLEPLPYALDALEPVLSKDNVDQHYNVHTKKYVNDYNKTGDTFAYAGAVLHNMWWTQLKAPSERNVPSGDIAAKLKSKYGTFAKFKKEFEEQFFAVKGSGWVALRYDGRIITLDNHVVNPSVVMVVDVWEHAWYLTHKADKTKYIKGIWSILDWDVINQRFVDWKSNAAS